MPGIQDLMAARSQQAGAQAIPAGPPDGMAPPTAARPVAGSKGPPPMGMARPEGPPIASRPGAGAVPPRMSPGFQKFAEGMRANPRVQAMQQKFQASPFGQKLASFGQKPPAAPANSRDSYAAGPNPTAPAPRAFKKGGMVERSYAK